MMNFSPVVFEILFALLSVKVSSAINRKLYRKFREANIDVTPEQWTVLHYLWSKEGVTQQELCTNTFKDKPSMTRLIDNLEKLGFVERRSNQYDRRINLIYLTEKGKNAEEFIQPVVMENIKEALNGIPEEDLDVLKRSMNKIFSNIKESLNE